MVKIIAFNAPPNSGKTTACNYLWDMYEVPSFNSSCYYTMQVHSIYRLNTYGSGWLKENRNTPLSETYGKTLQEAYDFHEKTMIDFHGECHWIDKTIESIKDFLCNDDCSFPVVSVADLKFDSEFDRLADVFGLENVQLIKIHRKDCHWSNGSFQSWITDLGSYDITNNLSIGNFYQQIDRLIKTKYKLQPVNA
jgi:hypothetical protein